VLETTVHGSIGPPTVLQVPCDCIIIDDGDVGKYLEKEPLYPLCVAITPAGLKKFIVPNELNEVPPLLL